MGANQTCPARRDDGTFPPPPVLQGDSSGTIRSSMVVSDMILCEGDVRCEEVMLFVPARLQSLFYDCQYHKCTMTIVHNNGIQVTAIDVDDE